MATVDMPKRIGNLSQGLISKRRANGNLWFMRERDSVFFMNEGHDRSAHPQKSTLNILEQH